VITAERYGWHPKLIEFGRRFVLPYLQNDAQWHFEKGRETALNFAQKLSAAINNG
jgi:hypothetical protein